MKVKNLVLMALVATMGLVSCSKDEHEDGVKTDTMPKSVTIKLPNIQKTVKSRATVLCGCCRQPANRSSV